MEQKSTVQSIERALNLLELLSQKSAGMHLVELSEATGLHKSSVHRLLLTLGNLGYIRKNQATQCYQLTMKLYNIAGRVVEDMDIWAVARPHLDYLRDLTDETVHLVLRDGNSIIYLYKAECTHMGIRMASYAGMRRPLYCTATGKSILATLTDGEVAQIWKESEIRAYTENTIVALEPLREELAAIRLRGYALDNEENECGVRCIGAAIHDYSRQCSAAFSISAPVSRLPDERVEALAETILTTQRSISQELGYLPK